MGTALKLKATDNHELAAYKAEPDGIARGGIVIIQEIFGVNDDIRETVDNFAKQGYVAIAPALFDRHERDAVLKFNEDGMAKGRSLKGALNWEDVIKDVDAAIIEIGDAGKVGVVGFCMGGSVAWFAAARSAVSAAVCYYGGDILSNSNETPKCPVMFHWGAEDAGIPLDGVNKVEADHPYIPSFVYEGAGHGFSCSRRGSYHKEAAGQAMERTLEFLSTNIG
ncbi:MAG: carboxymethylenebutenolidase [Alphaproteobacteria bacterium]|nr:carboxymethylenebutenolidase [Alphaproteobacteria bacterium]HCP01807.1 carboxymethylenebutenolidase [Rhodospirillaceae bacterium]